MWRLCAPSRDTMVLAITLRSFGGPEVLKAETVSVGAPGPGEIRVRQTAIGVNFHDIYVRSGLYRTLTLPGIPGVEAVGFVDAVGAGIRHLRPGDRVGYVSSAYGAYTQERLIRADRVIQIPPDLDDRTAAALLVKGLTACMLLTKFRHLRPGDWCLVHAAAGGVGRLLCQWADRLGIRVIGTVGNDEKASAARKSGCHHVILYREEDFVERTLDITGGKGVDVVYDSVGRDTLSRSIKALGLRGHLVSFGQSSGNPDPVELSTLAEKSISISRPILFHYIADREPYQQMVDQMFDALAGGLISGEIGAEFALKDAAAAHRALELRETVGATILLP